MTNEAGIAGAEKQSCCSRYAKTAIALGSNDSGKKYVITFLKACRQISSFEGVYRLFR